MFDTPVRVLSEKYHQFISALMRMNRRETERELSSMEDSEERTRNMVALTSILNAVCREKQHEEEAYYEYMCREDCKSDIALNQLTNALNDSSMGKTHVEWNMIHPAFWERKTMSFEAYHIDMDTWRLMKMLAHESKGNSEGYTFRFKLPNKVEKLRVPYCDCYEVSATETIRGNRIDSNADTWATAYHVKAEQMYAFYLTDISRYAVVYVTYWCY